MSSLGEAWTEETPGSASKLNVTGVISGSGDYLAGLDWSQFKILVCTADGSGLIEDHAYLVNDAADELIDLSQVEEHTHFGSTTGGTVTGIFVANPRFTILQLLGTHDLLKAQWIETVTSTGSIENKTDGTTGERSIRLRPNGTTGSGATISYPYMKLDFSAISAFQTKLQIETATSIALHSGVGADDVTAADSNTRKYNAEVCTATNSNWWLRTASGSANSTSDSGIAISTSRVGIKIEHHPADVETDLYINAEAVFQKTTNIPVDGATANINLIKHSVKNSTGADRPLLHYGSRLSFKIDTTENWVSS